MSHKKCARDFGVVLFLIGLLACIPGLTLDSYFLGVFKVNIFTNILHLATGLIAYILSHSNLRACKLYFQLSGLLYGFVAILGFGYGNNDILGYIANNMPDTWLHLIICLLTFYLGFLYKNTRKQ
jgi:hypothetical protein